MKTNCSFHTRKVTTVLLVFLYWSSGGVLLGFGSVLIIDSNRHLLLYLVSSSSSSVPSFRLLCIGLVFIGVVKLLAGVIGCISTLESDNRRLRALFAGVAVLTLLAELTVAAVSMLTEVELGRELSAVLSRRLAKNYGIPGFEKDTIAVDMVQYKYGCCGIGSPDDYRFTRWKVDEMGGSDLHVPRTCCVPDDHVARSYVQPRPRDLEACQNPHTYIHHASRYTQGCVEFVRAWLEVETTAVTSIGLIAACIDLLCLKVIYCCCCHRKHRNNTNTAETEPQHPTS